MFNLAKMSSAVVAIAIITGCSAKSNSPFGDKPYLEMTEAEQQIALDKQITTLKKTIAKTATKQQAQALQFVDFQADAKEDMIYTLATYPQKVSKSQLKQMKTILAQVQDQLDMCVKPEVIELNKLGIGFQMRMVDKAGTKLYESEACEGVKAAKPTVKLRGPSSAG